MIVYTLGLFLFACLYVVTAAPHVLGVFAVAYLSLTMGEADLLGEFGL